MKKTNHLVYTRFCFRSTQKISLYSGLYSFVSRIEVRLKTQFKEDSKTSKTKEATKEIRNNIANGHELHTTWFSKDVIRFIIRTRAAGEPNCLFWCCNFLPRSTVHETRLKSALGLCSTNAIHVMDKERGTEKKTCVTHPHNPELQNALVSKQSTVIELQNFKQI